MPTQTAPDQANRSDAGPPLLDRLRRRVANVERALERRDATRPDLPLPPQDRGGPDEAVKAKSGSRDLRALKVVYRGFARAHRHHRARTGESASPALKAAARAFRQEPSVFSLVLVAGHMDDLGLLKW